MGEDRYESPIMRSEWPFPTLLGSNMEDWPSLTGVGYPDLSVLGAVADSPEMQVHEARDGASLVVSAEVPGVDPDTDIQITLTGGNLDLHVVRREESELSDSDGFTHSQSSYGELFYRTEVPGQVTCQDVRASYSDGLLEIRVPMTSFDAEHVEQRVPVTSF